MHLSRSWIPNIVLPITFATLATCFAGRSFACIDPTDGGIVASTNHIGSTSLTPQPDLGFVHRFEPATTQGAPFVLLLHGTGGDENSLVPLGKAMAPGAALLSPRGKVVEQGMARFFRRLAEGDFDQEDLEARTAELADFVMRASAAYAIPAGKLVAAGFSNGANIASSLLLRFPHTLAGAVLMRGMVPFVPKEEIDLQRRPVLMLSGEEDPIVGTDEVAELANIFRAANAEVTLHWETAGHTLSQGDVLMAFDLDAKIFLRPTPQDSEVNYSIGTRIVCLPQDVARGGQGRH